MYHRWFFNMPSQLMQYVKIETKTYFNSHSTSYRDGIFYICIQQMYAAVNLSCKQNRNSNNDTIKINTINNNHPTIKAYFFDIYSFSMVYKIPVYLAMPNNDYISSVFLSFLFGFVSLSYFGSIMYTHWNGFFVR